MKIYQQVQNFGELFVHMDVFLAFCPLHPASQTNCMVYIPYSRLPFWRVAPRKTARGSPWCQRPTDRPLPETQGHWPWSPNPTSHGRSRFPGEAGPLAPTSAHHTAPLRRCEQRQWTRNGPGGSPCATEQFLRRLRCSSTRGSAAGARTFGLKQWFSKDLGLSCFHWSLVNDFSSPLNAKTHAARHKRLLGDIWWLENTYSFCFQVLVLGLIVWLQCFCCYSHGQTV